MLKPWIVIATLIATLSTAGELCAQRVVQFAGYDWEIKRCDSPCGPGPNFFSDAEHDIWVDSSGLHLTISERNGAWYATEAILQASLGYGTYAFHTRGRIDIFDPCMVVGLFTWDTGAPPPYREIDLEFARWCDPSDPTNAQYVVQPWSRPGNLQRFRVDLEDANSELTHIMHWQAAEVRFSTYHGHHNLPVLPPVTDLIFSWTNTSLDVPTPGNENVRINFWLYTAAPPAAQGNLLITDFQYAASGFCGDGQLNVGETCDDGGVADGDGCDSDCQMESGTCCVGEPSNCLSPSACSTSGRSVLILKDADDDAHDQMVWRWRRGTTDIAEFGDPVLGRRDYGLCLFDDGERILHATVPADTTCRGRDCWSRRSYGFLYRDLDAANDGTRVLRLHAGTGSARIKLSSRGRRLPLPGPTSPDRYLNQSTTVTAELLTSEGPVCWKAEFADSRRNDGQGFKAVSRTP